MTRHTTKTVVCCGLVLAMTLVGAVATTSATAGASTSLERQIAAEAAQMVNSERSARGLGPVSWVYDDNIASQMVRNCDDPTRGVNDPNPDPNGLRWAISTCALIRDSRSTGGSSGTAVYALMKSAPHNVILTKKYAQQIRIGDWCDPASGTLHFGAWVTYSLHTKPNGDIDDPSLPSPPNLTPVTDQHAGTQCPGPPPPPTAPPPTRPPATAPAPTPPPQSPKPASPPGSTSHPAASPVVDRHTTADGSKVVVRRDGTRTVTRTDGTVVTTKPDGTRVTRSTDGKTTTVTPDGKKVTKNKDGANDETVHTATTLAAAVNSVAVGARAGTLAAATAHQPVKKHSSPLVWIIVVVLVLLAGGMLVVRRILSKSRAGEPTP